MDAIKDAERLSGMPRDAARAAALTALSNAPRADLYGAYAINDESQVTGHGSFQGAMHAFFFRASPPHAIIDLGALPNSTNNTSQGSAVGEGGEVVGEGVNASSRTHAFYWDQTMGLSGAPLLDLGSLSTGATDTSRAHAVNRWGVVVGESGVPNASDAFRWDRATGMRSLGDLPGGAIAAVAYAVRDGFNPDGSPARADIVGRGTIATGTNVVAAGMRAVAWPGPAAPSMPNGPPIDLNTLLVPPNPTVTLIEAKGINNLGVISAKGITQGVGHVYILVPVELDVMDANGMTPYRMRCLEPFTE